MTWPSIVERLASARSYWLSTVARGGAAHVVPVWGAVGSGVWYCYTERATTRARNLAVDPRVAVPLNDAEAVLIVHGLSSEPPRPPPTGQDKARTSSGLLDNGRIDRQLHTPLDHPHIKHASAAMTLDLQVRA